MCRVLKCCLAAAFPAALAGCNVPNERLNAPPQGFSESPHPLQEHFIYMQDNAMLADMCFSDVHFIPHTAELNGLGARRLKRYAKLLAQYGGTLSYDTEMSAGEPLVNTRIEHAKEFLQLAGLSEDRFDVQVGGPGGRGIPGDQAIAALQAGRESEGDKEANPMGSLFGGQ